MKIPIVSLASAGGGPSGGGFPGGSVAPPDISNGDGFIDYIIRLLSSLVDSFASVLDWLSYSFGDFIDLALSWIPFIGDDLADAFLSAMSEIRVNNVPLNDISIILFMVGFGLFFFVCYQFFAWLRGAF